MKNLLKISLIVSIALSQIYANEVDSVNEMFLSAKTSGELRLGYYSVKEKVQSKKQSVTAIGGKLKFETASLKGVSAGVAMYASQNINAFSGNQNDGKFSDFLTSSEKGYVELAEAYINYSIDDFNIRVGRQVIDTPLADSDDIAMTSHSFEAVVATYAFSNLGLTLVGANVQRMQGVDANYENVIKHSWMDTGDNATNMVALLYANDAIEASSWYYDVDKSAKAIYTDIIMNFEISNNNAISLSLQYLNEKEEDTSGIDGNIAGIMLEALLDKVTASLAYNSISIDSGKTIFEGFGGGCSYTNMQTTTAGTLDTNSKAYVISLGYEISDISLFTAYGDFESDADNSGHLTELDAGVSYAFNDSSDISFVYVGVNDKSAINNDTDEIKIFANYSF